MKLVIDANIIVAALIRDSKARQVIISKKLELVSPNFFSRKFINMRTIYVPNQDC